MPQDDPTPNHRPLGVYVHVPYCASRCGYCDFNTYIPGEAGRGTMDAWLPTVLAEVAHRAGIERGQTNQGADSVPGSSRADRGFQEDPAEREIQTVFFGGGTPTLLPPSRIGSVIGRLREFGVSTHAEITVEANPETLSHEVLDGLLAAGVTRLSIGMQSADPQVLAVLDRRHLPDAPLEATSRAHTRGFRHISLDLIYGSPGETTWADTVRAALDCPIDHVSAYALTVEPGTALARRIATGVLPAPDPDAAAEAYEVADDLLSGAGMPWYEISNWSRPGAECRHNLNYWGGGDWWGIGPGAHGHSDGRRYRNVKHPVRWQAQVARDGSAEEVREEVTPDQRHLERVMLGLRLRGGIAADVIWRRGAEPERGRSAKGTAAGGRAVVDDLVNEGLLDPRARNVGRLVLTRAGRLLADRVTLALTP